MMLSYQNQNQLVKFALYPQIFEALKGVLL